MSEPITSTIGIKVIFTTVMAGLAWILTYAGMDIEVYTIFGVLIVIDFITGLGKSIVLEIKITSKKWKHGILSKLSMLLLPIVLSIGAKAIGEDASRPVIWSMNLLILSEVYSTIGNIYTIRTKKYLPEWDVIALLAKQIRDSMIVREETSNK